MRKQLLYTFLCAILLVHGMAAMAQHSLYALEPVGFDQVQVDDLFWKPRMDKVATVTLRACIDYTEYKTPRIRNFEIAAGKRKGKFEGIYYDDSDVYKALEAMAYCLRVHPDSLMEKKADEWISKIAAAQLPDGYINTYYTLNGLDKRWTDMSMHEDYNGGHLIEAGVAYYYATGKRQLLDVAIRFADHFNEQFGPGRRHWVTGHEELELALVKLYRATGNVKYLDLAAWLLEERGHKLAHGYIWTDWKDTAYAQDVTPVRDTKIITGHAVRAMYLYSGAADVAALLPDTGYLGAMQAVWQDVVYRNMYLTGGIGSSGNNEGFTKDYDLPNEQAYCETCASVGMVLWNHRMNLLTGESKYVDVLERSLYNAALDGLSLAGDKFFYGNPLASDGQDTRSEWFGTACCPANIARLVASLGNYIYGRSTAGGIWVNLFISSHTSIPVGGVDVGIEQRTDYPWNGRVSIIVSPAKKTTMALHLRIPGWAVGKPVPGDLYHYVRTALDSIQVLVNGKEVPYRVDKGYALIERLWTKGDVVTLVLPMQTQLVEANQAVAADRGRVAIQRGPLVYCVEGADNAGRAWNLILPLETQFTSRFQSDLLGGVITIEAKVPVVHIAADGLSVVSSLEPMRAIPYFAWCNRGAGPMQVWLPAKIQDIKIY